MSSDKANTIGHATLTERAGHASFYRHADFFDKGSCLEPHVCVACLQACTFGMGQNSHGTYGSQSIKVTFISCMACLRHWQTKPVPKVLPAHLRYLPPGGGLQTKIDNHARRAFMTMNYDNGPANVLGIFSYNGRVFCYIHCPSAVLCLEPGYSSFCRHHLPT